MIRSLKVKYGFLRHIILNQKVAIFSKPPSLLQGETIFLKNDNSGLFYIIIEGQIEQLSPGTIGEVSNTLGVGESFGRQEGTLVCQSDCIFAVLDQRGYESSIGEWKRSSIKKEMDFVRGLLFSENDKVGADRLSRLTLQFQKMKIFYQNYLFNQGDFQESVYAVQKGEIELNKNVTTSIGTQAFKIMILSQNEFVDDYDFFLRDRHRSLNAVVVSNDCTIFRIGRLEFERMLRDNQDIQKHLWMKFSVKKQFIEDRVSRYLSMRFSNRKSKAQSMDEQAKLNMKNMIDELPYQKAKSLKKMNFSNAKVQSQQTKGKYDPREMFMQIKQIGNFQLAMRNFKAGKRINLEENDQDKIRNLVMYRLGIKGPLSDRNHYNSTMTTQQFDSTDNLLRKVMNPSSKKERFFHLEEMRKTQKNLRFKQGSKKNNKFLNHLILPQ